MKVAAVAALCVAPLAFAGSLDMNLRSRGLLEDRNGFILKADKDHDSAKVSQSNGNDNSGITSITSTAETEVILIWVNEGGGAATSTVNAAAMATATQNAAAATQTVIVGGADKVYNPDSITANVGDMVIFVFQQENHTATTSAFTSPCVANGVFDTGFMPNPNDTVSPPPQAGMLIQVDTPIWFYCRQTGHCGDGMTFAINPTANKTEADFKALAIQINGTGSTAGIIASGSSASASTVSVASSASATDVAPPAASSDISSSSGSTGLTTGNGVVSDGACVCAVECAAGTIPNIAIQAISSFGGMGSAIPAANFAT